MNGRGGAGGRWLMMLALVVILAGGLCRKSQAQMYGVGYAGYGVPGPYYGGLGYGYPAMAFGMGYPRLGFGYGYPMYGYGYVAPGLGYSGMGYGYGGLPYARTLTTSGAPYVNPLFGVGLSPLGVNSALSERYLLGRGAPSYDPRSYAPGARRPTETPVPQSR